MLIQPYGCKDKILSNLIISLLMNCTLEINFRPFLPSFLRVAAHMISPWFNCAYVTILQG